MVLKIILILLLIHLIIHKQVFYYLVCKILNIFTEQGELIDGGNEHFLNDNIAQLSEESILSGLESSEVQIFDIDYTQPITIEIGATDRPQQDNSLILGKNFFSCSWLVTQ